MNNIFILWWQQLGADRYFANSGQDYVLAVAWFVGIWILLKLFQLIVVARLQALAQKTRTKFDDVLVQIFVGLRPPFYLLIALYVGIRVLTLPLLLNRVIAVVFIAVVVYEIIRALEKLVRFVVDEYIVKRTAKEEDAEQRRQASHVLTLLLRIVLWTVGITIALANMGVEVTSLIASLGIGGVAVALALQNILGDLFSSFSLYLDKPFRIGDFIVIGQQMGTVEKIGLKSTRIRSISGEELVVSNNELTTAHIQNFGRMQERRVVFAFGLVYGTPADKLARAPQIVKDIITGIPRTRFDRCHFYDFGESSLLYETVYYVNTSDYNQYMDIQQQIHVAIYSRFAEEGLDFAYPTHTVFVKRDEEA